ncbi:MAG: FAD-containing oxidoreductase [Planctomycetota bacterium]|nr:MAG: FAD-containing oxidoreductase [Planctomycetota bacterium]
MQTAVRMLPEDEHNAELLRQVAPADWQNPTPSGRYHLVAIGGGTAGIISALAAAGLGGRAALVERGLLGGDCLNYGCVPSKALLRAARAAYDAAHGERLGLRGPAPTVDFPAVMERMRRLRAEIGHHDSAARFRSLGVDVFLGEARFTAPDEIAVGDARLPFARCVIATGGRAAIPNVPGLAEVGYLTNETVFSLTELPRRLIVLGGGPIGCELAQAFRRFGSEVTIVQRNEHLLPKEDRDAAEVIANQLASEGVKLFLGWSPVRVATTPEGKSLTIARDCEKTLVADAILVAAGRQPNVAGLDLEAAGVNYTAAGVEVDDFLRTSNPRVYAAGDVCSKYQFTHAADAMARACVRNSLFFGRQRLSRLVVPRTTYTDPEVAHVGLTATEAHERGVAVDSYRQPLAGVDRAVLDGETAGSAVVHTRRGTGRIVGATIVAAHAGEMIGEITLMMARGIRLGKLADVIHCYPTQVEALRRIADQYQRTRLTPLAVRLLKTILSWRA